MTPPLRIAVIASNRFPIAQPFAGGLEAHVWHLARSLAARGHQVSLFAASGSDAALNCSHRSVRQLRLSPAAEVDTAMPPAQFMADHHAYLTLMMELAGPAGDAFDVIHNHSLHHLPVAMAPVVSTPMLCTLHTPPTPWLESAIECAGRARPLFAAVSRHTAAAWKHVLDDVAVVPNGVDVRSWPLGPGGRHLAWFGRLTPEKGAHVAIDAARRAGFDLRLAGPVSDLSYFHAKIEPRLTDGIAYVGHLDQTDLASLVGGASATLVTPMWDEPYGLVVAESVACGTPVVAFDRGGIPEILDAQCGRLVPAGDVAAMASAIPEVLRLSRAEVRKRAVMQCSADTMVTNYLGIYQDMIDRRNSRNNDRLLHSPSRLRPPHKSVEHLRPTRPPGHRVDVDGDARLPSVRLRGSAST